MTPIISGLTNKFNTRSVKCWSPFDIDSNQSLATTVPMQKESFYIALEILAKLPLEVTRIFSMPV